MHGGLRCVERTTARLLCRRAISRVDISNQRHTNHAVTKRSLFVQIRYYIDSTSGLPHVHEHGVTEEEVEQVLTRPGEDRPGSNGSRIAIGLTDSGRYLRVIYVRDPKPDSVFVVTAYELHGKPLKAYRRRHEENDL
jgi:hypothetical protein